MLYFGFHALDRIIRYAEDMVDLMYQGLWHAQFQTGQQIASATCKKVWAKVEAKWAVSTSFHSIFILYCNYMCLYNCSF